MSKTELVETAPLPFELSSTVKVTFTDAQLVGLALQALVDAGHEIDVATIKSSFHKGSLTIVSETSEGKPIPKKRAPRKPAVKKAEAKTTVKVDKVEPEAKVVEPTKAEGKTPFSATTVVDNEAVIADVKADAGVEQTTAFTPDTTEIAPNNTGAAPSFDFDLVGEDD